jgi:anti-sigma regulatory factor (Ser/Thr protein kinase)
MIETTLQVKADATAPRISRTHLNEIRDDLGNRFEDVELVVSELVTNSVRHAEGDIQVVVRRLPGKIRIEVTDQGPGFTSDTPRGEGMGLNIVERIADNWGIEIEGGCRVWVELGQTSE